MANQPINRGIRNSWSLVTFARTHGRMKVGDFTNRKTKESFKACAFIDPNDQHVCFVSFSHNLGVLTPQEIAEQKDNLQVVEFNPDEDGVTHYSLCKRGDNAWDDVDLGL